MKNKKNTTLILEELEAQLPIMTNEQKVNVQGGGIGDNDFGDKMESLFGNNSAGNLTFISNDFGSGLGSSNFGNPFTTSFGYNDNSWDGGANLNKDHNETTMSNRSQNRMNNSAHGSFIADEKTNYTLENKSPLFIPELQLSSKSIKATPVNDALNSSLKTRISSLLHLKTENKMGVTMLLKEPKCPVIKQPDFEKHEPRSDFRDYEPDFSDQDNMENLAERMDDENYARAKEELRELEREESRRLRHLAKFESESHKVVNELEEVVAGRNELASEREELKIIHRTLRFEFNKRKETEKVERAVEKLERDRNKLEWECEDLENKDELDPLESIDLAFKQKKLKI